MDEGIFDTCYPDEIGEIIIVIGQFLSETLAFLLLGEGDKSVPLRTIERKITVTHYSLERLLGAPSGSVKIFDFGRLGQWFEPDEKQAEIIMDAQVAAGIPPA